MRAERKAEREARLKMFRRPRDQIVTKWVGGPCLTTCSARRIKMKIEIIKRDQIWRKPLRFIKHDCFLRCVVIYIYDYIYICFNFQVLVSIKICRLKRNLRVLSSFIDWGCPKKSWTSLGVARIGGVVSAPVLSPPRSVSKGVQLVIFVDVSKILELVTWHLKIGHPKRKLVFQTSIFSCYVSFREDTLLK